jgi:hypothetical protein
MTKPAPLVAAAEAEAGNGGLSSARWAALLDEMEAGLDSFPPLVAAALPDDPGPLPPALAERAVRTLRRMAEVEAELQAQQAEIARELVGLAAARTAAANSAPAVPRFLDTKA